MCAGLPEYCPQNLGASGACGRGRLDVTPHRPRLRLPFGPSPTSRGGEGGGGGGGGGGGRGRERGAYLSSERKGIRRQCAVAAVAAGAAGGRDHAKPWVGLGRCGSTGRRDALLRPSCATGKRGASLRSSGGRGQVEARSRPGRSRPTCPLTPIGTRTRGLSMNSGRRIHHAVAVEAAQEGGEVAFIGQPCAARQGRRRPALTRGKQR